MVKELKATEDLHDLLSMGAERKDRLKQFDQSNLQVMNYEIKVLSVFCLTQ